MLVPRNALCTLLRVAATRILCGRPAWNHAALGVCLLTQSFVLDRDLMGVLTNAAGCFGS